MADFNNVHQYNLHGYVSWYSYVLVQAMFPISKCLNIGMYLYRASSKCSGIFSLPLERLIKLYLFTLSSLSKNLTSFSSSGLFYEVQHCYDQNCQCLTCYFFWNVNELYQLYNMLHLSIVSQLNFQIYKN